MVKACRTHGREEEFNESFVGKTEEKRKLGRRRSKREDIKRMLVK
jgi:hypothetical protein